MYKEIFASLAKDSNLYYKIKSKEEAEWFANELLNHGYSDDKDKFDEWFEGGRDCLIVYKGHHNKVYVLVVENVAMKHKIKYEPAKTVVNPTYDDLLPLFSDTDSDDPNEVRSKHEEEGERMKKDLIEIVTEERSYYVKGSYEEVKRELRQAGENVWVEFNELTELFYLPQEEHDIDRLLLRVSNIIAIHKLHEGDDEG